MANNKTDMERLGLFSEMGYTSLGDKYPKQNPKSKVFHESAFKGKQMLPGGSKTRSALQAGYFSGNFQRVLEGEAYTDSIKNKRQARIAQNKTNITSKSWLPSSFTKKPSGLGNHFGTFAGVHPSFAPNLKAQPPYKQVGRNFTTTPGKKGTGYGYNNITFQPYPNHSVELYDHAKNLRKQARQEHEKKVKAGPFRLSNKPTIYFDVNPFRSDRPIKPKQPKPTSVKKQFQLKTPFRPSNPGKKIAGCKAGTFESYPKHSVDLYSTKPLDVAGRGPSKDGKKSIFHPSPGPKSTPTKSILDLNVTKTINRNNYKSVATVLAF